MSRDSSVTLGTVKIYHKSVTFLSLLSFYTRSSLKALWSS